MSEVLNGNQAKQNHNGHSHRSDTRSIIGLNTSETCPLPEFIKKVEEGTKQLNLGEEVFGTYCNVNTYIAAPLKDVYNYAADVYSLEEWTYSMRNMEPIPGNKGMFLATELLAPETKIWTRVEAFPDSHVVDYLCAWDQGNELWMRYYMRFVDAQATVGKPGTILMWLNCKHPYYNRGAANAPKEVQAGQARTDRPWVGDFWPLFKVGHNFEAQNFKLICEYRFGHKIK